MRLRRHALFADLVSSVPKPVTILDVGGTELYWKTMGITDAEDLRITLLNLNKIETSTKNMISVAGDATRMDEFQDQSFDVVFSNSVIEHVGALEDQRRMAREVVRIGKRYFVQTPNYWFPIEPHFLLPGFQWLPVPVRVWLIRRFNLGWYQKVTDPEQARDLIHHNRLLTKKEFQGLFPGAALYEEKIAGLTKSFIVYSSWE
jgi:SAM-dependent methyltransferase